MSNQIKTLIITVLVCVSLCACNVISDKPDQTSGSGSAATSEPESAVSEVSEASEISEITEDEPSRPVLEKLDIVVLGDSIARGYGLKNVESQRYSALLGEKLKDIANEVEIVNFGIDGQTGAELSEKLKTDPYPELASADKVIISIGGNNILGGLPQLVSGAFKFDGDLMTAFSDYVKYLFGTGDGDRSRYEYSVGVINDAFVAANSVFESAEFEKLISEAAEKLKKELPEIIGSIRELNPEADIYVQTIYNPYRNVGISLKYVETPLDLDSHGEKAVAGLNAVITSLCDSLGYSVVPVHDAFDSSDDKLTNAGIELLSGSTPLNFGVDPHPNAAGHKVIAGLIYDMIRGE